MTNERLKELRQQAELGFAHSHHTTLEFLDEIERLNKMVKILLQQVSANRELSDENDRYREALEKIVEVTGTSTLQNNIARKALEGVSQILPNNCDITVHGLTPGQILKVVDYYMIHTGKDPRREESP